MRQLPEVQHLRSMSQLGNSRPDGAVLSTDSHIPDDERASMEALEAGHARRPYRPKKPSTMEPPRWTQHFDLNGWRTARLCVSMHTMGDSIELVSCDRTTQPNLPLKEDNPDAGVTEEDLFGTGEE